MHKKESLTKLNTAKLELKWIELPKKMKEKKSNLRQGGLAVGGELQHLLHGDSVEKLATSDSIGLRNYNSEQGFGGTAELLQDAVELPMSLKKLWRHIRYHAVYHPELLEARVQGMVYVDILINRYGQLVKLKAINGHKQLSEWIKMALYRALHKPFLRTPMSRPIRLKLRFKFYLANGPPPTQKYVFNYDQMNFDIPGYIGSPSQRVKSVKRAFVKYNPQSKSDWNFSKKIEPYIEGCAEANEQACNSLKKFEAFR